MKTSLKLRDYHQYEFSKREWIVVLTQAVGILLFFSWFFYRSLLAVLPLAPLGWLWVRYVKKQKGEKRRQELTEQFRSLGIETSRDAEATCNNPNKSVYSLFREFERFAYMSPLHTTFTNHGMYVFVEAKLLADVDGCHIYDMVFRNTRVRCVDASPDASLVAGVPRKAKTLLLAVSDIQNRTFLESIALVKRTNESTFFVIDITSPITIRFTSVLYYINFPSSFQKRIKNFIFNFALR